MGWGRGCVMETPRKVKFALPEAFAEETDISTQTDAIACRNFDVDSVSLLTSHLYVNHGAHANRNTHCQWLITTCNHIWPQQLCRYDVCTAKMGSTLCKAKCNWDWKSGILFMTILWCSFISIEVFLVQKVVSEFNTFLNLTSQNLLSFLCVNTVSLKAP